MTKSSKKLKKPDFGPFWVRFPNFGDKKIFLEDLALSCTTSHGILALYQSSEKTNDTIPRKCLDKIMDGWKDERTDRPYFIGPFRLLLGVQKER